MRVNSTNELGYPWASRRGIASGTADLTWTKWILWLSIDVVNCGYALSRASWVDQS